MIISWNCKVTLVKLDILEENQVSSLDSRYEKREKVSFVLIIWIDVHAFPLHIRIVCSSSFKFIGGKVSARDDDGDGFGQHEVDNFPKDAI